MTWASPVSTEGRGVRVGKATAGSPRQHSFSASHTGHCSRPGQALHQTLLLLPHKFKRAQDLLGLP